MIRLKVFFLSCFFLCAIPCWRYLDVLQFILPISDYSLLFFMNSFIFISLPLFFFKFKRVAVVFTFLIMSLCGFIKSFGTDQNNILFEPQENHCASLSYTHTFYNFASWMTPSHSDDLEIRNQLCWLRKLIVQIPQKFNTSQELEKYLNKAQEQLLIPKFKYRTSLPLIGLYHLIIFSRYSDFQKNTAQTNSKMFINILKFWSDQYTFEIHSVSYPWWDFPHGPYIKWEYGFFEKNWEKIIEFLRSREDV